VAWNLLTFDGLPFLYDAIPCKLNPHSFKMDPRDLLRFFLDDLLLEPEEEVSFPEPNYNVEHNSPPTNVNPLRRQQTAINLAVKLGIPKNKQKRWAKNLKKQLNIYPPIRQEIFLYNENHHIPAKGTIFSTTKTTTLTTTASSSFSSLSKNSLAATTTTLTAEQQQIIKLEEIIKNLQIENSILKQEARTSTLILPDFASSSSQTTNQQTTMNHAATSQTTFVNEDEEMEDLEKNNESQSNGFLI
jgi:hypothetical protein